MWVNHVFVYLEDVRDRHEEDAREAASGTSLPIFIDKRARGTRAQTTNEKNQQGEHAHSGADRDEAHVKIVKSSSMKTPNRNKHVGQS